MASVAVDSLIMKLARLLNEEVTLLRDVRTKVEGVRDELCLIQAYLKDADAKADTADTSSHAVKVWVNQLRRASFRIEDAVDFYIIKLAPHPSQRRGMLCKFCLVITSVVPRHRITSEIVNVTASIRKLYEDKQALGLSPSSEQNVAERIRYDLRMGSHFIRDDELVGVDYAKNLLIDWLIHGEARRTIISVVGEGGLGKTAIVRNLYNKHKEDFDCYAWITVSHSFKEEHLQTIMQTLYENDGKKYPVEGIREKEVDKCNLTQKLRDYLQGKSYMIVFDDVWEINFWECMEFALPADTNIRSRIIITTRDRGIAEFCQRSAPVHIHELKPLPADDALKLFLLKTFQFDHHGCPQDLNDLSQRFVKRCKGVPLAIVVISGLLSTKKKTVSEWQKVYDSLRSKFSTDPHLRSFYLVLLESYHDLPYHLRLCLLYFGLFPQDYSVKCSTLIRLWVAEGFVNENEMFGDQTLEEAAEDYLAELIRRSLVKVSNVFVNGKVKSCRVHDLMHDFIVRKCEELNFCQVVSKQQFGFHEWTRRISIQNIDKSAFIGNDQSFVRVRSCLSCGIEELSESVVKSLFSGFNLLVTLGLEDFPLDHLPEVVGNLLNLKYLSLRKTKIKTIPKSIGKLQKLQTLNLRDTQVLELPMEINKLVKLRHLLSYSFGSKEHWQHLLGFRLNGGIGGLTDLQSLAMVDTSTANGDGIIREMENMINMKKLGIVELSEVNGSSVCNAIKNMPNLCSLSIKAAENCGFLVLQAIVDPPANLQRLYLNGPLQRLPEWIPKLKHLIKLRLIGSRLAEDPLPKLEGLPELLELHLDHYCESEEVHFKCGWFEKLKELTLQRMNTLRTLKIDKGALPKLEVLRLGSCPQIIEGADAIQNLEALKNLYLIDMPIQFKDDIALNIPYNIDMPIQYSNDIALNNPKDIDMPRQFANDISTPLKENTTLDISPPLLPPPQLTPPRLPPRRGQLKVKVLQDLASAAIRSLSAA
ncbi:disease resistance protein RPM1 isoform X2 [Arachis duranensis]|uniref:Disease resistance protein RPM1 isoform X1 n=1 Tax=Arachis duranensis TaxID=130453 RepID=A0A9C6T4G7_ARADU|nr:disease resistance protein RPM1 isoform X1 [Arachis duranensis]XP_052107392.1 disease resistance protein RPM1 isoform X2 [Arachis duranensis]